MRVLSVRTAGFVCPDAPTSRLIDRFLFELAGQGHTCKILVIVQPSVATALNAAEHRSLRDGDIEVSVCHDADIPLNVSSDAPDWILLSSSQVNGDVATRVAHVAKNVIYIAETVESLPFGPESMIKDAGYAKSLAKVTAVVAADSFVETYFRQWAGTQVRALTRIVTSRNTPFVEYLQNLSNSQTARKANALSVRSVRKISEVVRALRVRNGPTKRQLWPL